MMNSLDFTMRAQLIRDQLQDALNASVAPISSQSGPSTLPRSLFGQQQQPNQPPAPAPAQAPLQQAAQGPSGALQAATPPQPPVQPAAPPQQPLQSFAKGGGAWTRKEGKNPEGGLNAKGRASLRAQGQDIKPPVSAKQAKKSPKAAARRKSFCARMSGMPGPMKDEKGRPTRKALSLRKWDCRS